MGERVACDVGRSSRGREKGSQVKGTASPWEVGPVKSQGFSFLRTHAASSIPEGDEA